MRFTTIGTFKAVTLDGRDCLPEAKKARALLGYLLVTGVATLSRQRIADLLWSASGPAQAAASVRQALYKLRRDMEAVGAKILTESRDAVGLMPGASWSDIATLLRLGPDDARRSPEEVLGLLGGEFLPDMDHIDQAYDEWLLVQRAHLKHHVERLLDAMLDEEVPPEAVDRAIDLASRIVRHDPGHERAYRHLMRAYAALGQRDRAMKIYEQCRAALSTLFDIHPSRETEVIYTAIKHPPHRRTAMVEPTPPSEPAASTGQTSIYRKGTGRHRLRLAVLPLRCEADDTDLPLSSGLAEEISTSLARFRWMTVVSPMALARGLSNPPDLVELAQRLDLDYVLTGRVDRLERRIAVRVNLIDLKEDMKIAWTRDFTSETATLHRLRDDIASRVVGQIDPEILLIESRKPRTVGYEAPEAYRCYVASIPLLYSLTPSAFGEARTLLEAAVTIDPNFSTAHAWLAFWHMFDLGQGWSSDAKRSYELAVTHAYEAVRVDPGDALALTIAGHFHAFRDHDFDRAQEYFDRALGLNPNLAFAWAMSAPTYCYIGRPQEAVRRLDKYREIAPFDPYASLFDSIYAIAYLFLREYRKAVEVGSHSIARNPRFSNGYKPVIAALGHLGEHAQAADMLARLKTVEPSFSFSAFRRSYPFLSGADREHYLEGLRLAGLTE